MNNYWLEELDKKAAILPEADRSNYMRRLKRLSVSPDALLAIIRHESRDKWKADGLPRDASILNAVFDSFTGVIDLAIHSESFESIPEGTIIPEMNVILSIIPEDK